RDLARGHASAAEAAFRAAADGGPGAEANRARGMGELGAALALDPTNHESLGALLKVALETPVELSPEAEAELEAVRAADRIGAAGGGAVVYGSLLLWSPLLLMMTVRRPVLFALLSVTTMLVFTYLIWVWRARRTDDRFTWISFGLGFLHVGLTSTIFGPLVMTPGMAVVTLVSYLVSLRADRATRRLLLGFGLASVLVPLGLQFAGLVPASYSFEPGAIRIVSNLVELSPGPALGLLALGTLGTLVSSVFTVGRAVDALMSAERRNLARAFRLRQLLPGATGTGAAA
ncbi:MAG: hypothetical protein FJ104_15365, partial [Deltaproteobacteria bacterium]|nr:hypothetical protein [Deltaproteobacteria bacterium]